MMYDFFSSFFFPVWVVLRRVGLLTVLVQIKEKRLHVPLVDRLPEEAPPVVVAVVGPPGVSSF